MKYLLTFLCLLWAGSLFGQIKSGPMLGYSEMKEVLIWVQTQKSAKVEIAYWEKGQKSTQNILKTDPIQTQKSQGFIAKAIADQVSMDKKYEYEVWVDGKKNEFFISLGVSKPKSLAIPQGSSSI